MKPSNAKFRRRILAENDRTFWRAAVVRHPLDVGWLLEYRLRVPMILPLGSGKRRESAAVPQSTAKQPG
jgi:hypothetical protein